jgi:hypothetical protein
MKTGYIHVLHTDGKFFLKCCYELVLTPMDDYGRKVCFDLTGLSPPFFSGMVSFEDPSVPGEL